MGEKLDIIVVPGFKLSGVVTAIYDDAVVLENLEGNYEIAFKGAITAMISYNLVPEDQVAA
jgi:sRNA-binding regulator protein Hfq